jgi:hypothetical protein
MTSHYEMLFLHTFIVKLERPVDEAKNDELCWKNRTGKTVTENAIDENMNFKILWEA